ncbi:hypothetical protein Tco_0027425 [Tanacetum coccineum]
MLLNFSEEIQDTDDEEREDARTKDKKKQSSSMMKNVRMLGQTIRKNSRHRMPTNAKIYNGTGDPDDHISRFNGMRNQGEWPMPVWRRMFQQMLDGKTRPGLTSFLPEV